jgi:hypothetical protein
VSTSERAATMAARFLRSADERGKEEGMDGYGG